MKLFFLFILIPSFFLPVFSENHKKYKKDDFEKIKIKKIDYLNKKLICVKNSQNFEQIKQCWEKKKRKIN